MIVKACLFFGTIGAMNAVAQIPTSTPAGDLGKGSTQVVLSICLVAVCGALIKVFSDGRKDRDKDREKWEKRDEKFTELMVKNAEAMTKQADSNAQIATAIVKCDKD